MRSISKRLHQKADGFLGKVQKNAIKTFWFNTESNAGDLITPFLLKKYGFTPILTSPEDTQAIICGSLMQRLDRQYEGYILGTGFLNDGQSIEIKKAKILAVRGELTRDRIGAPKDTPLGDPGLLMSWFLPKRIKKSFLLG